MCTELILFEVQVPLIFLGAECFSTCSDGLYPKNIQVEQNEQAFNKNLCRHEYRISRVARLKMAVMGEGCTIGRWGRVAAGVCCRRSSSV
jgi:hypothetical protein